MTTMDRPDAFAADLLRWSDRTSSTTIMELVSNCLASCDWAPAPTLALEVDVTALMCENLNLAMAVMHNTEELAAQVQALINNELAAHHTSADDADMDTDLPSIRATLQLTQVPLPLMTCSEVHQQAVQLCNCPTAPSCGLMVSMLGIVSGLTPAAETIHSQRFQCPACNSVVNILAGQNYLPCCNVPRTAMMQEDLTGRVMVPAQQLWVSELSSATGRPVYGTSTAPLLVHVLQHQVGSCSLGSAVHIIGHCQLNMSATGAGYDIGQTGIACNVHVHANSIQPVLPHILWDRPPAHMPSFSAKAIAQQPLQLMWDLLTAGLGRQAPLDPHVAVSLLLSAAAVGASKGMPRHGRATDAMQVNVLVLHEHFAPHTPCLLKEAAALLSPQSVSLPAHLAEQVTPIMAAAAAAGASSNTGRAEDALAKPLFASILHTANIGVAVAELPALPNKVRQQLLEALQQRATPQPTPGSLLAGGQVLPLTATCWGAAAYDDVCPSGLGAVCTTHKNGKAAKVLHQGFDLCLGDGTVHEDDVFWLLELQSASARQQQLHRQQQEAAAACLRHLVAVAAGGPAPVLTDAAQAFLGRYFLVLRQSLDTSCKVSKPVLLASLVRVATAVARLHQRNQVLEVPDATLAVLLTEHSLAHRFGDCYRPLELPWDLNPNNGRSLDEEVNVRHNIMARVFKQYTGCGDGGDCSDYGDCGSGCSGMAGPGGRHEE